MDLTELADRIRAAAAEAYAPPGPGETKRFVFPTDLLGDDGWLLLWEAVHAVREMSAATFAHFSSTNLAMLIADELEHHGALKLDALIARLAEQAETGGQRAVATALANVEMPQSAIDLGGNAFLVRALADRHADHTDEDLAADFEIRKALGTAMGRPLCVVDTKPPLDTQRTAAILTVEEGTKPMALRRARARVQYAIAMWVVVSPPERGMLQPDIAIWVPQPSVHYAQRHRAVTDSSAAGAGAPETGDGIMFHRPYALPHDDDLRLPFLAMQRTDRRGAQAVLSASLQLQAAGRASRLQPSERVRGLMAAVECLGEQPSGKKARQRFYELMDRFGAGDVPQRGWDRQRVMAAFDRMSNARNIATHGADAVLLDLGYPVGARRQLKFGKEAVGADLAAGSLEADLPILVHVVGRTLERTIRQLASDDWNDRAFARYFSG